MAALKHTLDDIVEVPGPLREFYTKAEDGKFHLDVEDESARLKEFRETNIRLMKQVAELQAQPPATKQVSDLEAQLSAERQAHAATQLKHLVTAEFLRQGGRNSAVEFMSTEAAKVFTIENGKLTTQAYSSANPSESLSIEEWVVAQSKVSDFAFQPSRGGGARPNPTVRFGERPNQKVLKNPTPQDLGRHADAIAKGTLKIEYSE